MAMETMELTPAQRLYGLSLIWQEANYNFAFFDRVPDLDWDAAYREYIPAVLAAEDLGHYYWLLARFVALLQDGHSPVIPPRALYDALDRPALKLMRIQGIPVVTNVSAALADRVPIGSQLLEVDGISAEDWLNGQVVPLIAETAEHRRLDHAVARMLLGPRDTTVLCSILTPSGEERETDLVRDRKARVSPWVRYAQGLDPWEFQFFDEWFYEGPASPAFEYRNVGKGLKYVALRTFMKESVADCFVQGLPEIAGCAGLIVDLRQNHGGQDGIGYRIASHLLARPSDPLGVRSPLHVAYRHAGNPARREMHEESWGTVKPVAEPLTMPLALLTSSETGSAAEDFLMVLQSGRPDAVRVGSATAGSTGQPLIFDMPGGGMAGVCTIRCLWPDEVWRAGIVPHVPVAPTIEDVMADRDPVLQAAINLLEL